MTRKLGGKHKHKHSKHKHSKHKHKQSKHSKHKHKQSKHSKHKHNAKKTRRHKKMIGGGLQHILQIRNNLKQLVANPNLNKDARLTLLRNIDYQLSFCTDVQEIRSKIDQLLVITDVGYNMTKYEEYAKILIKLWEQAQPSESMTSKNTAVPPSKQVVPPSKPAGFPTAGLTGRYLPLNRTPSSLESVDMGLFDNFNTYKTTSFAKKQNFYTVETLSDGNCFYSAYFRLAHIFKSDANLNIFNDCQLATIKMDEHRWIQCFKQNMFPSTLPETDTELISAFDEVFDLLFQQSLESYLTYKYSLEFYNSQPENVRKNFQKPQLIYLLQQQKQNGDFGVSDMNWIDPLTTMLNHHMEILININDNKKKINPFFEEVIIPTPFSNDPSKYNLNLDMDKFKEGLSQLSTFTPFMRLKNNIKIAFIKGLHVKNIGLKDKISQENTQYATSIEISIIKNYIDNIKIRKNPDIISFITISSDNTNKLNENKSNPLFIFYFTSLSGKGNQNHYKGLYSKEALNIALAINDSKKNMPASNASNKSTYSGFDLYESPSD
jgi:hypothetical protein